MGDHFGRNFLQNPNSSANHPNYHVGVPIGFENPLWAGIAWTIQLDVLHVSYVVFLLGRAPAFTRPALYDHKIYLQVLPTKGFQKLASWLAECACSAHKFLKWLKPCHVPCPGAKDFTLLKLQLWICWPCGLKQNNRTAYSTQVVNIPTTSTQLLQLIHQRTEAQLFFLSLLQGPDWLG